MYKWLHIRVVSTAQCSTKTSADHKRIVHFRRVPATHIFVLMISSDARDKKPYAVPVQWIPYAGLKEEDIRKLVSNLCQKMVSLGMRISGSFIGH